MYIFKEVEKLDFKLFIQKIYINTSLNKIKY